MRTFRGHAGCDQYDDDDDDDDDGGDIASVKIQCYIDSLDEQIDTARQLRVSLTYYSLALRYYHLPRRSTRIVVAEGCSKKKKLHPQILKFLATHDTEYTHYCK
jgi:hypothetical protein